MFSNRSCTGTLPSAGQRPPADGPSHRGRRWTAQSDRRPVRPTVTGHSDAVVRVPFAASTFIHITLTDLLPETTIEPDTGRKVVHALSFIVGLSGLGLLAAVT